MAATRLLLGLFLLAVGCAHGPRENPMIARAAADLQCDAPSLRWHTVSDLAVTARGCDRQARYVGRCHDEFENPARPTYPPIEVCEWFLEGVGPVTNPPR